MSTSVEYEFAVLPSALTSLAEFTFSSQLVSSNGQKRFVNRHIVFCKAATTANGPTAVVGYSLSDKFLFQQHIPSSGFNMFTPTCH